MIKLQTQLAWPIIAALLLVRCGSSAKGGSGNQNPAATPATAEGSDGGEVPDPLVGYTFICGNMTSKNNSGVVDECLRRMFCSSRRRRIHMDHVIWWLVVRLISIRT